MTDVIVAAVHLNDVNGPYKPVHLNDDPPNAAKFDQMGRDLKTLQGQDVHARPRDFIRQYGLDVEERMSLSGIERVIDALRREFGPGFLITLAPVGSALSGGGNLSGFDYERLYRDRGGAIAAPWPWAAEVSSALRG
ncbi:hypothetical protein AB0I84_39810 [Streptomyces spectabilis]|uniref:hypothetical protein n=1 Tax=Streptomyces spectabilis TaxID=68270 RepID=UPI0033C33452